VLKRRPAATQRLLGRSTTLQPRCSHAPRSRNRDGTPLGRGFILHALDGGIAQSKIGAGHARASNAVRSQPKVWLGPRLPRFPGTG
jgi:hypothetical protein